MVPHWRSGPLPLKLLATIGLCRQYLLATHRVVPGASQTTRCVRRSHTHRWIPVPSTTVLSRRMNAQNRTPTCLLPSSGAYTWRKPFPYPLWTGWNRQLQCHANDMACAWWTQQEGQIGVPRRYTQISDCQEGDLAN